MHFPVKTFRHVRIFSYTFCFLFYILFIYFLSLKTEFQVSLTTHYYSIITLKVVSHVFVSHLYVFFGEMSIQFFGPFLIGSFIFLDLSCISCLYIFEINCLSVASFAIIFSHSEGCLFTLLIFSFVVQKLLILIRSHFLFLLLFPVFWEVDHRGSCCDLCWRVFCLCSPLGVLQFLVLHLDL